MTINRFGLCLALIVGTALYGLPSMAASAGEHTIKVGKKGEFILSSRAQVGELGQGELVLPPGRYRVQYREEGSGHFLHFEALSGKKNLYYRTAGRAPSREGDVKCRLKPLPNKVAYTAIHTIPNGGSQQITEIDIAGENVAHLF